ncbi:MAG: CBS domain-containing protein, partial [Sphingomonadales bacterium]
MKVKHAMSQSVHSIESTESIADAAAIMAKLDIGVLPVVDSGKLVGIVTDRDIVVRGVAHGLHSGSPVLQVMTH